MSDPVLISAVDLPFSDDIAASDFPFSDTFDFTFDDLTFADDLLIEPPDNDDIAAARVFDCESPEIDSCKSNSPLSLHSGKVIADNCCDRDVDSSLNRDVSDRYVNSSDFDDYNIYSGNSDRDVVSRSFDDNCKSNGNVCDRDVISSDIDDHFDINGNSSGRDVISKSFDDNSKRTRSNCGRDVSLRAVGDDTERNRNNFGRDVNSRLGGGDSRRSRKSYDRDVSERAVEEKIGENYTLSNSCDSNSKIKGGEVMIGSKIMTKRKKDEEYVESESSGDGRTSKIRRSVVVNRECQSGAFNVGNDDDDDDEKRKARLMRNRESAQLSRLRKKQYVEELEEKVRAMHSTISELNGKISYIMAENATLRQQLSGGATCPPPPVMYPMAPMGYPWMPMPCPPYMIKPQGSQVPLVPIPRLKPQQLVHSSKDGKKLETKKKNEGKTKKVASISFLGLLFFFLLFGGLVPMVNVRYGGVKDGFIGLQKGVVLMVDNYTNKMGNKGGLGITDVKLHHGRVLEQSNTSDVFGTSGNMSGPLVASLYVPRNDKMVKIDGNLIIHSVLASERAKTSHPNSNVKTSEETSLAVARIYPPYLIPGHRSMNGRNHHLDENSNGRQRALPSGSSQDSKSAKSDGSLQQWFREGLAGPMLSSGMCTEVFQFDVSPTPGSIVPATSMPNTTSNNHHNSTRPNKPRNNRRILKGHPIPFESRTFNLNDEHTQNAELNNGTKPRSSMVVSVLVDPREVGDGDGEGVIRSKTLSRIFVVVLIDSVKYVTYSCMLPFVGSGNHLVTN